MILMARNGETFQISPEDAERVIAAGPWGVMRHPAGHTYIRNGRHGMLHRFLMTPGAGLVVDHLNGDGCDNRRENLRVCTQAENCRNRKTFKNNKTGVRGVSVFRDRYRVQMDRRYLGVFKTIEEAAAARFAAEQALWSPEDLYRAERSAA